ncbi:2-amino-4-hydroxy-6-hydroxymethyldihydropteridine diphosphokinase [Aridibaculum aurantiacum]|uniref:2-amino-4-hydroxy-6- hydroxymethyldihydropteridine diphosphokinase n=1 Tax=Aridibaculum aurantiacum TaxID=2810307 RepID=UPI001A96DAFE|nr:2-amino-4-hydroxy-6-hydroxymethyldihydropteridine diphosphokinase [Aridibaculum aurantiacum]
MNTAFLLLGGNLGDRKKNLEDALQLINERAGKISAASAFYETAAWGKEDQPNFLNQAVTLETRLSPTDLLRMLLAVEKDLGRERIEKLGPRLIDIDILFYGDMVLHSDQLTIPHPHITKRRFVLEPLHDLAPDLIHPAYNKTIAQLLQECTDPLPVVRLEAEFT